MSDKTKKVLLATLEIIRLVSAAIIGYIGGQQ